MRVKDAIRLLGELDLEAELFVLDVDDPRSEYHIISIEDDDGPVIKVTG